MDAHWCEKKIVAWQHALGAYNVARDILIL